MLATLDLRSHGYSLPESMDLLRNLCPMPGLCRVLIDDHLSSSRWLRLAGVQKKLGILIEVNLSPTHHRLSFVHRLCLSSESSSALLIEEACRLRMSSLVESTNSLFQVLLYLFSLDSSGFLSRLRCDLEMSLQ